MNIHIFFRINTKAKIAPAARIHPTIRKISIVPFTKEVRAMLRMVGNMAWLA
ncbi:hypothetical protein NDK43_26525 [Neobacillus pocheonensis]|uniref:Uncharacterized protein n=1 Tax=Neobacillus pocheonensis TaxID=363869 RepID=A0ABT0WG29_9BACI|nr:hypothetical protein [Neobacillus pocheonensis]